MAWRTIRKNIYVCVRETEDEQILCNYVLDECDIKEFYMHKLSACWISANTYYTYIYMLVYPYKRMLVVI